jgi:glycosyltransferase involved in cell wall biosynthesis
MRVLIAGTTYAPAVNGQAVFSVSLAEGLARAGHEVLVLAPSESGKPQRRTLNGVTIQTLNSIRLTPLHPDGIYTPFPERLTARAFNEFQPDIVHVQDHYPISRAALVQARRRGMRVIGTNHFMPENLAPYVPLLPRYFKGAFDFILWEWMLFTFNRLDLATAPSRTAAAILRRRGLETPVYPVSCGVDTKRYFPNHRLDRPAIRDRFGLHPHKTTLLYVGRVDGDKRLEVLIEALGLLRRSDLQLAISGKGVKVEPLKNLAASLGIGEQTHFLGFVPEEDLPGLVNSADFFVMPSDAELLSIATLQAMSCGLPVVAAHAQALPELVGDGLNGWLFRPGDVADAARAIARLADYPQHWRTLGAASLERAQQHSLDHVIHTYEKLYELARLSAQRPVPRLPIVPSLRRLFDQASGAGASHTRPRRKE